MKRKLVPIITIIVMLAVPALATGTLTEIGSVGLPFGTASPVGSTGTTGSTATGGTTGATGATGPVAPAPPVASCPSAPCEVVSETTGMQVKVGSHDAPMTIPRNGVIVAWTIHLSDPTASQIAYFDQHEGG